MKKIATFFAAIICVLMTLTVSNPVSAQQCTLAYENGVPTLQGTEMTFAFYAINEFDNAQVGVDHKIWVPGDFAPVGWSNEMPVDITYACTGIIYGWQVNFASLPPGSVTSFRGWIRDNQIYYYTNEVRFVKKRGPMRNPFPTHLTHRQRALDPTALEFHGAPVDVSNLRFIDGDETFEQIDATPLDQVGIGTGPNLDGLYILNPEGLELTIRMVDISGRVALSTTSSANNFSFTGQVAAGMYVAYVEYAGSARTQKVVIK